MKYKLSDFFQSIPWKSLGGNLLFLVIAFIIIEYPVFIGMSLGHLDTHYFVRGILILLPIATLLLSFTKKPIIITFLVILVLSLAVETTMMVMYGEFLAFGNILSAIRTTSEEARGFLSIALPSLWYQIPLVLLMVAEILVLKKIRPLPSWNISLTVLLTLANLLALEINKKTYSAMGEVTRRLYINEVILSYPPYNTLNQVHIAGKRYRQFQQVDPNFTFGAYVPTENRPKKEIYILAIGESLRYKSFSLNGTYERSTTPLLEQTDNLILYNDYYSPACLTSFSVPIMLSRATVQDFQLHYKERGIIQPFKETGFKTFVVANKWNTIAQETYLTAGCDSMVVVDYDRDIPGQVKKLSQEADRIFFLLHFYGNHLVYTNYDEEFDVYQPSIYHLDEYPFANKELNTNSYDNTILYTDYLLHTIITDLDSLDIVSTLLFTPDHGENISDVAIGHGYSNHPPKEEYHIPLVVWYSNQWKATYPSKLKNLYKHQNSPINGENIFYTTYDMANIVIDTTYAHPEWSIFNDSLELRDRYLLMRDGINIQLIQE